MLRIQRELLDGRVAYVCDVCGILGVIPGDMEVVYDGASFGTSPLAHPCDNGCDDDDDGAA